MGWWGWPKGKKNQSNWVRTEGCGGKLLRDAWGWPGPTEWSRFSWWAADREEGKDIEELKEKGKVCGLEHIFWSPFSLLQSCGIPCILPGVTSFPDENILSLLRNRHYGNSAFAQIHAVWCTCRSIYSHSMYVTVNEVCFHFTALVLCLHEVNASVVEAVNVVTGAVQILVKPHVVQPWHSNASQMYDLS